MFDLALMLLERELAKCSRRSAANPRIDEYVAHGNLDQSMDEYVLFGSASLIVRGVIDRDPGDIDLFTTKRVWGQLMDRPRWTVTTPNAGDPPMLVGQLTANITASAFFAWRDDWLDIDVEACLRDAEEVMYDGTIWRCVPLLEARRHKAEAIRYPHNSKRALHEADIAAIDLVLERDGVKSGS
jgi:hypothetical protein